MRKKTYIKTAIFITLIIFISLTLFYTFEDKNKHKKFVVDVFENYIILTDEEGRNITNEIKETYKKQFDAGKYDFIFSEIEDYDYTTYYDSENDILKINN